MLLIFRKLPAQDNYKDNTPKVLLKMDIEGSELEVLPDMIYEQSFKYIDGFMVEFHPPNDDENRKNAMNLLRDIMGKMFTFWNLINYGNHKINYIDHDDESYHLSIYPLPKC